PTTVHQSLGTYALRQEAQAPQDRHAQAEEAAPQEPPQEEEPLGADAPFAGSTGSARPLPEVGAAWFVVSDRQSRWSVAAAPPRAGVLHPPRILTAHTLHVR